MRHQREAGMEVKLDVLRSLVDINEVERIGQPIPSQLGVREIMWLPNRKEVLRRSSDGPRFGQSARS